MDCTKILLNDLRQCRQFTRAQQLALARRWRDDCDQDARRQLIESVMPWAVRRATGWQHKHPWMRLDELISAAYEGCILGTDRFDPERGASFTTYVTYWIWQKLVRCTEEHNIIHVANGAYYHARKLHARNESDEVSDAVDKVQQQMSSLDETEFGYTIDVSVNDAVDADMILAEDVAALLESIEQLSDREKQVVRMRMCGATFNEIGLHFGITRGRVRQVHARSLVKLRSLLTAVV
jgi:RNA polymerase sigma factor (sigma-70 family)